MSYVDTSRYWFFLDRVENTSAIPCPSLGNQYFNTVFQFIGEQVIDSWNLRKETQTAFYTEKIAIV